MITEGSIVMDINDKKAISKYLNGLNNYIKKTFADRFRIIS